MGQYADNILNGDADPFTGEWIGGGQGYPRHNYKLTDSEKRVKAIRKELAILIKTEKSKIPNITERQENKLVNDCRQAINNKYGKGWRSQI